MRKSIFFGAIATCIAVVSCTTASSGWDGRDSRLRLRAEITRVAGLHFEAGDRIGVYVERATGVWLDNRCFDYDGSVFTAEGVLWYNDLNESSTLSAYYPYRAEGIEGGAEVAADQRGEAFANSDLLAARIETVRPTSEAVLLTFRHLLCKLNVSTENASQGRIEAVRIGGSVLGCTVDLEVPAVAVANEAPAAIRAREVTADLLYEAIIVPQQAVLEVAVDTDDGRTRNYSLPSTEFVAGKVYTIKVSFTDEQIDVALSGQIEDWVPGDTLLPTDPSQNDNGEEHSAGQMSGTVSCCGREYPVCTLRDGRTWMAANLRCVPSDKTPSTDPTVDSGVWYPCTADKNAATDEATLTTRGLLYDLDTALAGASGEGARGICPQGWHLPTCEEFETLIAAYDSTTELVAQGFFVATGFRNVLPAGKGSYVVQTTDLDGTITITKGYLLTSTLDAEGKVMLCRMDCSSETPAFSLEARLAACGVPVRCVKDR